MKLAHDRSTAGLLSAGFLVSPQSWKTGLQTRNALGAPGRPGSRPPPKLSI